MYVPQTPRCCSYVLPWGQGYIRIYQIYEQMTFASECREQAREDTMLCIFHMFHPFSQTDLFVFYVPVDTVKPCVWVEGFRRRAPPQRETPQGT